MPCRTVNMLNQEDVETLAGAIVNPPDFLLTLNLMPLGFILGERHYTDLLNCKVFCLCLDNPIHLTDLFMPGQFERLNEFYFGTLENAHAKILEEHGINKENIVPFAHGGPPVDTQAPPFDKRAIDVMFSGGISAAETSPIIFERLSINDTSIRKALEGACENTLAGAGDIAHCTAEVFREHGIENDAVLDKHGVLNSLDVWTRTLRRHRLFETLKDLEINFYGNFHETFKTAHPKSVFHDPVSYRQVIGLSKNAKITINDTINLMDSALFRFYYALADGCLMATETNPFLAGEFIDGQHAIHLDNRDPGNADKIKSYLADPARSQNMVKAAQDHYAAHHTWAARVPPLLNCIRG